MEFDLRKNRLLHRLCQGDISVREAHDMFAKSEEPWSPLELMDRHDLYYYVRTFFRGCSGCASQSRNAYEPHFGVDLALPTCCRQIYHDAHSFTYSENTWSFTRPLDYQASCIDTRSALVCTQSFFLHRLHLDITVKKRTMEECWNYSFRYIAREFMCLTHFHADIEQRPFDTYTLMKWHFQNPADCTFLEDLPVLRDVKLKTVTITVFDHHIWHWMEMNPQTEDPRQYRWSMVQKQEWAAYVTRVLLRQEEPKHAAEEAI